MSRPDASRLLVCDIGFTCGIDGPGQRLIIYLKGCNLHCPWCALPETISPLPEIIFYAGRVSRPTLAIRACPHGAILMHDGKLIRRQNVCAACSGRECLRTKLSAFELAGREMTVDELVALAERCRPFFGRQGGITIGGGEPTCQFAGVQSLLARLKQKHFSTAMETNGTNSRLPELYTHLDFLFIDLKHPGDAVCKAITGQGNAVVLQNIKARFRQKRPMRVRIPLVPGFNADRATLGAFGRVLSRIGRLDVELLPFHRRGEAKWQALGKSMPAGKTLPPAPETIERACQRLARRGLRATTP